MDELRDAAYVVGGLKIAFGTKSGFLGYIEAENIVNAVKM